MAYDTRYGLGFSTKREEGSKIPHAVYDFFFSQTFTTKHLDNHRLRIDGHLGSGMAPAFSDICISTRRKPPVREERREREIGTSSEERFLLLCY